MRSGFTIQQEHSVSFTSPSSRTRSTSSTASKRRPKRPVSRTLESRRPATRTSSPAEVTTIGPAIDNIWDVLQLDPADRERHKMLSDISIFIGKRIKQQGWTQKEAAKRMGVTQPRVSNL